MVIQMLFIKGEGKNGKIASTDQKETFKGGKGEIWQDTKE